MLHLNIGTFSFIDAIFKFYENFKKEEVFGILKRKQAVRGGLLFLEIKYSRNNSFALYKMTFKYLTKIKEYFSFTYTGGVL